MHSEVSTATSLAVQGGREEELAACLGGVLGAACFTEPFANNDVLSSNCNGQKNGCANLEKLYIRQGLCLDMSSDSAD